MQLRYKTLEQIGLEDVQKGDNIRIVYQGKENNKIISGIYQGTKVIDWKLKLLLKGKDNKIQAYNTEKIVKALSTKQAIILLGASRPINNQKPKLEQRALAI